MANVLFASTAPNALVGLLSTKSSQPRLNLPVAAFKSSIFPELVQALNDILTITGMPSDTPLVSVVYGSTGLASRVYEPSVAKNADGELILQLPTESIKLSEVFARIGATYSVASTIEKVGTDYCMTFAGILPDGATEDEQREVVLNCRIDAEAVKDFALFGKAIRQLEAKGQLASIFMVAGGQFPQKIAAVQADGTTAPLNFDSESIGNSTFKITSYRQYENNYEGRITQEFAVNIAGFPGEYRANRDIANVLHCAPTVSEAEPLIVIVTGCNFKKNANGAYAILNCHITVTSVSLDDLFDLNPF
jgi:hypothetical protein